MDKYNISTLPLYRVCAMGVNEENAQPGAAMRTCTWRINAGKEVRLRKMVPLR